MATKPSILDVMKERPIIGDGSYVITLEKRGYVQAGCWTPEAVIEYPDAGKTMVIYNNRVFLFCNRFVYLIQLAEFSWTNEAELSKPVTYKCLFSIIDVPLDLRSKGCEFKCRINFFLVELLEFNEFSNSK